MGAWRVGCTVQSLQGCFSEITPLCASPIQTEQRISILGVLGAQPRGPGAWFTNDGVQLWVRNCNHFRTVPYRTVSKVRTVPVSSIASVLIIIIPCCLVLYLGMYVPRYLTQGYVRG